MRDFIESHGKQIYKKMRAVKEDSPEFRMYNERCSFTIRQLCKLLEIEVPREYRPLADTFVDLTPALKRHRNCQNFNITWSKNARYSFDNKWLVANSKGQALGFKRRYFLYNFEKHSDKELLEMYADYRYQFAFIGFDYHAYFDYRFFEKSPKDTVNYISYRDVENFRRHRTKKYIKYFHDKGLFLEKFSEFIHRDWIDTRKCSLEEFKDFAKRNPRFIVKPAKSCSGKGVDIVSPDDIENFYRECVDSGMVAEELIKQHKDLACFNEDTVNTLRVHTLTKPNGDAVLMTPYVRFGREGAVVDNGSAGGTWALVDPDTGIVISDGLDRNGNAYTVHADSKLSIKGFQVPCWDKVAETCLAAAKTTPQIPYIGWDVAVSEDEEVMFVEGNSAPAFFMVQMHLPVGVHKAMWKPIFAEFEEEAPKREFEGGDYRACKKDGTAIILGYSGKESNLFVPAQLNGLPVATIAASAFAHNENIKKVVLPDSLTTLYRSAFEGCSALEEVELGDSLEVINQRAFAGCTSLRSVCLPYGLKRISREAFEDCISLTEMFYYSKRGISDVLETDRSLVETVLPNEIDYIGPRAFSGCTALEKIMIPYCLRELNSQVFEGCSSLKEVQTHNLITSIGNRTFKGCTSLAQIRLPLACKTIGKNAFESTTKIISASVAFAKKYAKESGLEWRGYTTNLPVVSSHMVPLTAGEAHERFYDDAFLEASVERFEMRAPSYDLVQRDEVKTDKQSIIPSRFILENGVYKRNNGKNRARIMMVGDLMARFRQQDAAYDKKTNSYCFDFSFAHVSELLHESDFTIANMKGMASPSAPYTREREHVNARPHLNVSEEYLAAVRKAGFDAVVNAQNHIYDTGVRGIFETLDNQNRYQLMHTGAFVSEEDKRYLLVEISGIRVGVVAYYDGARQLMKKANFTKKGREIMLPMFNSEQIEEDIKNAREDGAEFIIAFCHWGREYTHELTKRQIGFAHEVANAGADYLIGAHSHCVQPYKIIQTDDGRKVPCLYSAGNFISCINMKPPITRDTLLLDIELARADDGTVRLVEERYHPCRIMELKKRWRSVDYAVIPTNADLSPKLNQSLRDAHKRIVKAVGEGIHPVPFERD